jgi:hypothetical protein
MEHYNADCEHCAARKEWVRINDPRYTAVQTAAEDRRVDAIRKEYVLKLDAKDLIIADMKDAEEGYLENFMEFVGTISAQKYKIIGLTVAVVILAALLGVACMILATGGVS